MGVFTAFLRGIPAPCDICINIVGLAIAVTGFVLSLSYDFSDDIMMSMLGLDGMMMIIGLLIGLGEMCCGCFKGEKLAVCGTICVMIFEFSFWLAAGICGMYSSNMYDKDNWVYAPDSACDTSWENQPVGCFNRTHTCRVDAPGDTFDHDYCEGACWEHTDPMLFAVSTLVTLVSLCASCCKCVSCGDVD